MADIKEIVAFSQDAIFQAMQRVGTDETQISSLLKPILTVLKSTPKTVKKSAKKF